MADNNGNNNGAAVDQGVANVQQNDNTTTSIDYEKIADILDGRMKATEDSVLKGYFKDQGLSGDEMAQAIKMFKEDKASKTPDIEALNSQITEANKRALNAELELKASTIAADLGVATAKFPYLLKMADTEKAIKDGKIDKSKLKDALEAVLKDVPELKETQKQENNFGAFKIGANNGDSNGIDKNVLDSQLAAAFGIKTK